MKKNDIDNLTKLAKAFKMSIEYWEKNHRMPIFPEQQLNKTEKLRSTLDKKFEMAVEIFYI